MPEPKKVVYLETKQLLPNPANPPTRTEPSQLRQLTSSIRVDGLQYPILVTKRTDDGETYQIIDGHRRWAVMKGENHEHIPCIIADGNSSRLYQIVNATSKPLAGKDWALVYIRGGQVPKRAEKNLEKLAILIGNEGIQRMADQGLAPNVYQTARRVANAIDGHTDNDDRLKQIVVWLIERKQSSNCIALINSKQDVGIMRDALDNDALISWTK